MKNICNMWVEEKQTYVFTLFTVKNSGKCKWSSFGPKDERTVMKTLVLWTPKSKEEQRDRRVHQEELWTPSSTGPFKHANSGHTDTGTPGQTDRQQRQEVLHNAATTQRKTDSRMEGRTVVSAASKNQKQHKPTGSAAPA